MKPLCWGLLLHRGTGLVEGVAVANPAVERQREELFLRPKAPATKAVPAAEKAATPQVIHLSPETVSRPATEMTMQSRVAAALALAVSASVQIAGQALILSRALQHTLRQQRPID